jgi:hypothetical protein
MRTLRILIATTVGFAALVATAALAAGGISVVTKTTNTVEGPNARQAKCAEGDQVLGGGFSSTNEHTLTQQSYPVKGKGWKVETLDPSGGQSTAYALCEKATKRELKLVSDQATIPRATSGPSEGQAKAKCPKGWQVLSGGYADRPPYQGGQKGEIAIDTSKRTDAQTWKVHGGNDGAPSGIEAFAICEKQSEGNVKQVSATDDSTTSVDQAATASCPAGMHVVGGGYQIKPNEAGGTFPRAQASQPVGSTKWLAEWVPDFGAKQLPPASITSYAECES